MPIDAGPHPSPEQLRAFCDGLFPDTDARALESHIAVCAECLRHLDVLAEDELVQRCRRVGGALEPGTPAPSATESVVDVSLAGAVPADLANHARYEIVGTLGAGGMGAVYKARHKLMDRVVALKIVGTKLIDNPRAVERFQREVRAAAQLAHPNIVTAHDAEQAGHTHFLVMEYVAGTSLAKQVEEHGPLAIHEACIAVRQAALGLQHAFEKGMVHRDIKPHNLMRTRDGWVKILDFGLARFVSETCGPDGLTQEGADGLTQEGAVMGTPDYLAPEQARDSHHADIRADIYSLGCTLYYLLTGRAPFAGGSTVDKLNAHTQLAPRPVHELRAGVPMELSRVVGRMLAKRPEERFQTPAEVTQALVPFLGPMQEQVAQAPAIPTAILLSAAEPPRRSWRRVWLAAVIGVLVLLLIGMATAFFGGGILRVRTEDGTIVLQNLPPDCEVLVDDKKVTVKLKNGGKVVEVQVVPGKHQLEIRWDGIRVYAEEMTLAAGEQRPIQLRLERPAAKLDPKRRVPADDLDPRKISRYELAVAGDGDPKAAPPELVAILGDSRLRHWNPIWCVAYSPDGKLIASASSDQTIRLWDAATGKQLAVLLGHRAWITRLAFSPDGKTLASCGDEPNVILWDVEKRQRKMPLVGHRSLVRDLAFHPDGKLLATVSNAWNDATLKLWDLETGQAVHTWIPHEKSATSVAFNPDGTLLATAGGDKLIKLWDVKTRQCLRELKGHNAEVWHALAFHPNGKTLLSADSDGTARLWDAATGGERKVWSVPGGWGMAVAFARDGDQLAVANREGTINVYDGTGKTLLKRRNPLYHESLEAVAFSPDGKTLAFCSWDSQVRLWDLEADRLRPHPGGAMEVLGYVAVSPDGRWVASASLDGVVRLWDLSTGKVRHELKKHNIPVYRLAFSPDGQLLASGGEHGHVCLWRVASGELKYELKGHSGLVEGLAFSADGKILASGASDTTAILWDVPTGTEIRTLRGHKSRVSSVAFSRDGKSVVTASRWESTVRFWDPATGREQPGLDEEALGGEAMAFHPDGSLLIIGGNNRELQTLFVWDYFTRKKVCTVKHHPPQVSAVQFAADGTAISCGCGDGTVCLWNPHTGKLKGHELRIGPPGGWICNAVFTPEGRHVVTANRNGTIYVLRLAEAAK